MPEKLTTIKWIYPTGFFGWCKNGDVREWGFRLDARTEITYYTYDWGVGVTFVLFGFGFEITLG